MAIDKQRGRRAVDKASIDATVKTQQQFAVSEVARLRRVNSEKSPVELLVHVNKHYLRDAKRIGVKAERVAIAQRRPIQSAASNAFKQRSAHYVLTVAEIHNLHPEDFETRNDLVEIVFAANWVSYAVTSEPVMGRPVNHWTQRIVDGIPEAVLKVSDHALGDRYAISQAVAKYGPDALRIGIGSLGHWCSGKLVIQHANRILGAPPETWEGRQTNEGGSSS